MTEIAIDPPGSRNGEAIAARNKTPSSGRGSIMLMRASTASFPSFDRNGLYPANVPLAFAALRKVERACLDRIRAAREHRRPRPGETHPQLRGESLQKKKAQEQG